MLKASPKLLEKRIRKGDRQILRELKASTGPTKLDFANFFERTFGKKPQRPVFMQKVKGGIVFYLGKPDYASFGLRPFTYACTLDKIGKGFATKSKLKGKVILVNRAMFPVSKHFGTTPEQMLAHEQIHLKSNYARPSLDYGYCLDKFKAGKISKRTFNKSLECLLLDELCGYAQERRTNVPDLQSLVLKHFSKQYEITRLPRITPEDDALFKKYYSGLPNIGKQISVLLNKKISTRMITKTIERSNWKNLSNNLEKLERKTK